MNILPVAAGPVPPFGAFGISQDFRTPYVMNFNLNIQRQLSSSTILQTGYVGSTGRKLAVLRDINQPINGVRPYAAQFPTLATIDSVFSMSNSDYNSLQVQLRQALYKGLSATFNYTVGHDIDNTSDVRNTVPTNSYDLGNERGNSTFDIRHIVTSFVSYQLPGSKFAPLLTRGWQVNSLITAFSGQPFSVTASNASLNAPGNTQRANQVKPEVQILGGVGPNQPYFDPLAFAPVTTALEIYSTGTLILDMTSPTKQAIVWRGSAQRKIDLRLTKRTRRMFFSRLIRTQVRSGLILIPGSSLAPVGQR